MGLTQAGTSGALRGSADRDPDLRLRAFAVGSIGRTADGRVYSENRTGEPNFRIWMRQALGLQEVIGRERDGTRTFKHLVWSWAG